VASQSIMRISRLAVNALALLALSSTLGQFGSGTLSDMHSRIVESRNGAIVGQYLRRGDLLFLVLFDDRSNDVDLFCCF
jgi:hypothetical protein